MRKQTLFVYTRLGLESWCKQIPKHLNEKTILLAFRAVVKLLPLFRAVVKFCSTNRLFKTID